MTDEVTALQNRLALRVREAAEALGISEKTLRKWMRDEDLPFFRLEGSVRIPTGELERWMAERTQSQHTADEVADTILREL